MEILLSVEATGTIHRFRWEGQCRVPSLKAVVETPLAGVEQGVPKPFAGTGPSQIAPSEQDSILQCHITLNGFLFYCFFNPSTKSQILCS